jgi:hypothetical protein
MRIIRHKFLIFSNDFKGMVKKGILLKAFSLTIILVMVLNIPVLTSTIISSSSAKLVEFQDAGEQLKAIGIVKGYKEYGLDESRDITEGELLAILSRTLRRNEITVQPNLVTERNWLDRSINDIYAVFMTIKSKTVEYYYKFLSVFPNYQPALGVTKDSWFFNDALYLRIRGYKFPQNFEINSAINERELYSLVLDVLSLGENNEGFYTTSSISADDKLEISLAIHGLLPENLEVNEIVTRGEAFNIILNVIQK